MTEERPGPVRQAADIDRAGDTPGRAGGTHRGPAPRREEDKDCRLVKDIPDCTGTDQAADSWERLEGDSRRLLAGDSRPAAGRIVAGRRTVDNPVEPGRDTARAAVQGSSLREAPIASGSLIRCWRKTSSFRPRSSRPAMSRIRTTIGVGKPDQRARTRVAASEAAFCAEFDARQAASCTEYCAVLVIESTIPLNMAGRATAQEEWPRSAQRSFVLFGNSEPSKLRGQSSGEIFVEFARAHTTGS